MQKTIVIFVSIMWGMALFAQEQLDHPKRVYVSPDGKLYVQKELPIYLWMSTSANQGGEKYRLWSEETAQYSNPMYFDTDGYNTVRSPSAVDTVTHKTVYPIQDIIFEVYADASPPVSKIDFGKGVLFVSEGKKHLGTGTKITLSARDDHAGVENIYFSLDGVPYKPFVDPIIITEEKEYKLKYYAVDNVGNMEEIHEHELVYDKTAPVSNHDITGDQYENILSARSKIVLSTEDKGVGKKKIYYSLDGAPEKVYTRPIPAAYLAQDDHTIAYYAIDKVGNKETVKTYAFYVDKTAPTIIEEVMGRSFFSGGKEFSSGKSRLKLTSFDNKAGVKGVFFAVNNGEYVEYHKPVFLTQASGNLLIKSYAVDNVNNRSSSQTANEKASIPYIDLTGPTLSFTFKGPEFSTRDTTFVNSNTTITLKGYDEESGMNRIEYSVNGSVPAEEYSDAFSIREAGYSIIDYTGFDNVDNTSSESFGCVIDNTGPVISYVFGTSPIGTESGVNVYPSHSVLFVTATDKVVGFQNMKYRLDHGKAINYTGMIKSIPKGKHTISLTAYDKLGNSTDKDITFIIE